MRLGEQEYRLAKQLAKEADCTVNEIVELSVRMTWITFLLGGGSQEQLKAMVAQAREIKKTAEPSEPRRPKRPPPKETLTHSPFASLKTTGEEVPDAD